MEKLKEYIAKNRPSLSQSSINTYASILKSLYHKVFGTEDLILDRFDDVDKILEFLRNMAPNKRKTILSALVVVTENKKYRDLMMKDVKDYQDDIKKQIKTPAQEASWVTAEDIQKVFEKFRKNADIIYKKKIYTSSDLQDIQSFIIMALLSGIYIPVRRSKDLVDWKIKNTNKLADNYLEKNTIYYNSYKTAKTYGAQKIEVPKELKSILTKWFKINPTDYLLFDKNLNKLSSVKLNQRLNKIFDNKKVAVNSLRHSYLTSLFGNTIEQNKEIQKITSDMGTSPNMITTYVKQ